MRKTKKNIRFQGFKANLIKAFSMIEISVVILIVTAIIAAISPIQTFLYKQKLYSGASLTQNSPVQSTPNLVLWYETTKNESISRIESQQDKIVTLWNDINPNSINKFDASQGSGNIADVNEFYYNTVSGASSSNTFGPTYIEKGINNLPTLRFDNSSGDYQYLVSSSNFEAEANSDLTLFLAFKYLEGQGFIIDRTCLDSSNAPVSTCSSAVNSGNPRFGLEIDSDGSLIFHAKSDAGNFGNITGGSFDTDFILTQNQPYIVTLDS